MNQSDSGAGGEGSSACSTPIRPPDRSRITVLGSANMDLVVRQRRQPAVGETIFGTSFTTVPGGKGLNQAIAAARAGSIVRFVGAVGRDANGEALLAALRGEGVDVAAVREVATATGVAVINVLDSGDNSIVVVPGANACVTAVDETTREVIESGTHLVMQLELDPDTLLEAASFARARGVCTVLTPAPVVPHDPQLIGLTDVLVLNAGEALQLARTSDVEAAAGALSKRARAVIVTLGAEGSVLAEAGAVVDRVPARRARAVDTTAAGDTFVGVLTARLAAGDSLRVAMEWATVASGIAVTRPGASTSMPRHDEIVKAMAQA